jgi:hypothetical protein
MTSMPSRRGKYGPSFKCAPTKFMQLNINRTGAYVVEKEIENRKLLHGPVGERHRNLRTRSGIHL